MLVVQNKYSGLTTKQAEERYDTFGANVIEDGSTRSKWSIFLDQFKSPIIYFLIIVSVITLFLGDYADTIIIIVVVISNALLGLFQESKAQDSISALKDLVSPKAKVFRDGELISLKASYIVPDDTVYVESGDKIPADGKLLDFKDLQINEAQLTGESFPVRKSNGDKKVFMGTIVVTGRGYLQVTKTGQNTDLGKIAQEVDKSSDKETPLQKKYKSLTEKFIWYVLISCIIAFTLGLIRQIGLEDLFKVTVSLGVSAIPEGLPVLLTFTLAVGAYRMSKKKAVIRNLPSASTLAGVDVVCTDKTGTITKGQIQLDKLVSFNDYSQTDLIMYGGLCNDSYTSGKEKFGDPLDLAITEKLKDFDVKKHFLDEEYPRLDEVPFNSDNKYQATLHNRKNENLLIVKGATEKLINWSNISSPRYKRELLEEEARLMKKGYRVISVCLKRTTETKINKKKLDDLNFVGFLVFIDPLRKGIDKVVERCHKSGIKVIMITGDHLNTAKTIARKAGIISKNYDLVISGEDFRKLDLEKDWQKVETIKVIARANPFDKSKLIDFYKQRNKVVAMTGDGVNDSPALSKADIGVAMGKNGTDAAREASDMVLLDDKFSTIVNGIEQARVIFDNLRKVISHLLVTSFSEILVIILSLIIGIPLPLIAVQILWLNLVTDSFLNFFIGSDDQSHGILEKPVRRYKREFIDKIAYYRILVISPIIAVGTIFMSIMYQDNGDGYYAQTAALITLSMFQWINSLNSRSEDKTLFEIGVFRNYALNWSLLGVFGLMLLAVYVPFMNTLLKTEPVDLDVWLSAFALTLPLILVESIRKKLIPKLFPDY